MFELNRDSRIVLAMEFFVGSAYGLWQYILPVHIRRLGAGPAEVGLALSAGGITMLLTFIPAGLLADRLSRRKVMSAFCLAAVLPAALLSLADRWPYVMLLLMLVYIQAAAIPSMNAYLTHANPKENLNRVLSMVVFSYLSGALIFRAAGGWIAQQADMDLVFLMSSAFFLLAGAVVLFAGEQQVNEHRSRMDYRRLLRNRDFYLIAIYTFVVITTMSVGITLVPNYLEEVIGLDLAAIGTSGTLAAIGGALLSLLLGRLRGRWGVVATESAMALALILLVGMPTRPWLLLSFLLMGSLQTAFPLIEAFTGRAVPAELSGLAYAVQGELEGAAWALSATLAGLLYEISPERPLAISAAVLLVVTPATVLLPRLIPGRRS